jgi:hypothetical protein
MYGRCLADRDEWKNAITGYPQGKVQQWVYQ